MTIAYFQHGDPALEASGVRLLNRVSALIREAFPEPPALASRPVGPHFEYRTCPGLFGGRRGGGPLDVVWDTNLLIDYFQHGRALWDVEPLPGGLGDYGDELEALQLIITVWMIRDIRFHVLPRVLVDAKHRLSGERLAERRNALGRFAAALRLVALEDDEPVQDRAGLLPPNVGLRQILAGVPTTDRALVADAIALGAHVFMTRDRGVLACRQALRPFGLLLASPSDVVEGLAACGALHGLLDRGYAYWPAPDSGRVTHLIKALPPPGSAAL
jgi:hypothetical protein